MTVDMHTRSIEYIESCLSSVHADKFIVVTHHAPSDRSIQPEYVGDCLSPAFASHNEELVKSSLINYWIHGHTHHCVDYCLDSTRVLSNQRGYIPHEPVEGFNEQKVIEV